MEHVGSDGEPCLSHPLAMSSVSADRRCSSVSPANLPRPKQEGIKPSATEPQLSTHAELDRNVR